MGYTALGVDKTRACPTTPSPAAWVCLSWRDSSGMARCLILCTRTAKARSRIRAFVQSTSELFVWNDTECRRRQPEARLLDGANLVDLQSLFSVHVCRGAQFPPLARAMELFSISGEWAIMDPRHLDPAFFSSYDAPTDANLPLKPLPCFHTTRVPLDGPLVVPGTAPSPLETFVHDYVSLLANRALLMLDVAAGLSADSKRTERVADVLATLPGIRRVLASRRNPHSP